MEWAVHSLRALSPELTLSALAFRSIPFQRLEATGLWATAFHVSNYFRVPLKAIPRNVVLLRSCLHALRSLSKNQHSHFGRTHRVPSPPMPPVTSSLLMQTLVSAFVLERHVFMLTHAPPHSYHWVWNIWRIVCKDLAWH